jgi:hypothetical protein
LFLTAIDDERYHRRSHYHRDCEGNRDAGFITLPVHIILVPAERVLLDHHVLGPIHVDANPVVGDGIVGHFTVLAVSQIESQGRVVRDGVVVHGAFLAHVEAHAGPVPRI